MTTPLSIAGALLLAAALAAWAYVWREERVPRRWPPALLRGAALFLVAAGLFLPPLRSGDDRESVRVVLLDVSRSMSLPVRPGGPTRADSARRRLASLDADRVYLFGDAVVAISPDSVEAASTTGGHSRVAPALESARLAGADSVLVLTDGEWNDRGEAERTAERLGLGVRELRIGEPLGRVGIAAYDAPEHMRGGDTTRITVELVGGGRPGETPDSVRIELSSEAGLLATRRVAALDPGRGVRAEVEFVPVDPAGDSEWRRYELTLSAPADPLASADRRSFWARVSSEAGGAILVSTDPDWELRFLLPVLERTVLGGATGFLNVGGGRYLEMGRIPRTTDAAAVVRAMDGARLVVIQADFGELGEALRRAAARHPRKLVFPTAEGSIPGTPVAVTNMVGGDWYPMAPVPPAPAARLIPEAALDDLPPLRALLELSGGSDWTILNGRRNRRGEPRPLFVAGQRGRTRWAVAGGTGYWRWAFRTGASRRVYEGMISGFVDWLGEGFSPRRAELLAGQRAGQALSWRIGADVDSLAIRVLSAAADTAWATALAEPADTVTGPTLEPGRYAIEIEGFGPEGSFRDDRPLEVVDWSREWLPSGAAPPMSAGGVATSGGSTVPGRRRPVWPFILAAVLLCVEWIWRQRIGLR